MQNTTHALDILGQKLDIPGLSFDDDGLVALDMPGDVAVYITRVDAQEWEISCRIENLGYPDAAMLRAMLEAHYLGAAVGAGRLALDSETHDILYGERWVVTEMDAAILERRFDDFAATAAFWLGEGTSLLLEQAEALRIEERSGAALPAGDAQAEGDDAMVMMRL